MAKKEAFLQFLKAARSLQDRGLSKEAIVQFAKNEFGELSELFKKQIDSLFKPKKGIENIKLKDEVFDDTVVKMQFDDSGVPFNPKNPLKTKSLTYDEAVAKEEAKAAADEDYIMKIFDPEDFAKGGRAGLYTGGMVDVEPNLSDIGHGSDALMARTRLVSPDGQATTSTGLNYLLAEDNDNIRVPFKDGLKVYPKIMASKSNQGLGNGKNVDLQDLTYGGTLMYDQGPFSAGIEYLKGKDKFDFKDKDDTLVKDTTDRELANLILMMKLKNGSIKFKGNKDNQMINLSKSFAQGGRIGFANGNGVADEDAEKAALGKRVRELMDEGFDMGEAVKKAMSEGYAKGGRIGYNKGKAVKAVVDKGRRGFMKAAGVAGAGIAALKTGLLGFGKEAAPVVQKAVETVSETAQGVPPYFFKLVEKIKTLGDNAPKLAVKDREVVTKYKDYTLTEDITTGEKTIQRMKIDDDLKYDASEYYGKPVGEEVYMSYKPGKGQMDETMKGKTPPDEYTEDTSLIRSDRPAEGEVMDTFDGVPDDILKEVEAGSGNVPESFYTGPNAIKKADGGRIGFESGKFVLGKNIYNLLKNNKKIKKAIDNIFGTGDYKLDADMAAESLVELNPKEFNNMLYEDLPDNVRSEIYGAVIGPIQNNALIASRAKKTANTIDISDPKVAEDFTNFMKNHGDPEAQKGIKELEETLLLSNAKRTKGRKDNSAGGIQTMLGE